MSAWAVTVWHDGEPVAEQVPCSDWLAGEALAHLAVAMWGGPVSLAGAVVGQRVLDAAAAADPTLFDEEHAA